ncbi:MAG: lasso peptide biosynthesis protein [bacterium]
MGSIPKIYKYPNIVLIARVLRLQRKISGRNGQNVFAMLEETPVAKRRGMKKETIDRYVYAALRLGGAFGMLNTCLSRSVTRCILHRENGLPSQVAFGLRKDATGAGGVLQGHCWLVGEEPKMEEGGSEPFDSIAVYPKDR